MSNIPAAGLTRNPSNDERLTDNLSGVLSVSQIKPKKQLDEEKELDLWLQQLQRERLNESAFLDAAKQLGGTFSNYPRADASETITLKIGVQDVVVKHTTINGAIQNHAGGGKRGKITKLSRASVRRMKLTARNVPEGSFEAFLTLTYPQDFPTNGKKVKRDLAAMRKWLKRRQIGGFWFLEFQKRGAPHYHLFLSNYPLGGVAAVSKAWFKIVGSQDPKHLDWHMGRLSGRPCLEYMRKPHAASFYATKYASKQEQKNVPEGYSDVGRFWGIFGGMRPVWRFVVGRGSHCVESTKRLVNNFRCKFDKRALHGHWMLTTFISTVMWGGVEELNDIMSFVKWTPF
ncbi:rolling circle replication-associated protein [Candidatus Thiothrix anitrata]|uniref:Replication-associated protein ORF2/G2P domain-containing protein n=1 Tax=Candidatus Thiothrix anitrata TaxID=2823902 RepID=A0ABX7X1S5_9GAMM|nr:hypothetical protein [Candidatus Thiothrix anitrata]QTR49217.1 hypothetical protein J8380_13225 [Candidatus Thiothrix anitrata]